MEVINRKKQKVIEVVHLEGKALRRSVLWVYKEWVIVTERNKGNLGGAPRR